MHALISSPFLEQYVLMRPGSRGGALLPEAAYDELRVLDPGQPAPAWLAEAVTAPWPDLDVTGQPLADFLLVRQPSKRGYGKASWETHLGCNYACKQCALNFWVLASGYCSVAYRTTMTRQARITAIYSCQYGNLADERQERPLE
ncbi:hypothetical protein [Streptomyces sp. SLBN-31]|uniref:hypothetical protein n=1 Tax=Streptomyces sp. SLBN-31 TaxID=2768444 RepID=UPI0011733590|nr:hypothetical protein [Streptomyces sp. SLBN-31]TQJ85278.1 hypothetical protein FBY22_4038 [Streptomyces sp. SLBN-31]